MQIFLATHRTHCFHFISLHNLILTQWCSWRVQNIFVWTKTSTADELASLKGNKSTYPQVNLSPSQLVFRSCLVNSSPKRSTRTSLNSSLPHKSTRPWIVYIVFSHSKSTRPLQKKYFNLKTNRKVVYENEYVCLFSEKSYENYESMYFWKVHINISKKSVFIITITNIIKIRWNQGY